MAAKHEHRSRYKGIKSFAFGAGIMDCRDKAGESAQYYEDALGYAKSAGRKKPQVLHIKHDTDSDQTQNIPTLMSRLPGISSAMMSSTLLI